MTARVAAGLGVTDLVVVDEPGVVRLPQLVRGETVWAPRLSREEIERNAPAAGLSSPARSVLRTGQAWILAEPAVDPATREPTGDVQYTVLARIDPARLLERDAAERALSLYALPFRAVAEYAAALRETLAAARPALAGPGTGLPHVDPRLLVVTLDLLVHLLDPEALARAVDRELGADGIPGRAYLDGWVDVPAEAHRGFTARLGEGLGAAPAPGFSPAVRAVPTRQLHITAGNAPVIPFLSFLRGLLTKGACTIKSASETVHVAALLGAALRAAAPGHPITRHTSVVYWPGGDVSAEAPLFAAGAYDRVVVWGSAETVRSVRQRAAHTPVVAMAPRYGVSLVGGEAQGALDEVATRATVDTLVWEQKACTASLVHYVEGGEDEAAAYCEALQRALARWDQRLPQLPHRAALGRLRLLRRGPLLRARWFENRHGGEVRSAAVLSREPFDLALHPLSRFVVVRPVERLEGALRWITGAVSTAGVFPERSLESLRDGLAAAGVANVFPLGESERAWAGMPHDGMRVLSQLVHWTSSGRITKGAGE